MSLHLMMLFTAHPAKLINLLGDLAFPGSWLLHAAPPSSWNMRHGQHRRATPMFVAGDTPGLGDVAHEPVFHRFSIGLALLFPGSAPASEV